MSDDAKLNAYFERIGFSGSIAPTLQTLEVLHRLHPAAIPFENLDPLLGIPVSLELRAIEAKLLGARRGGYCYEHNTLFLAVLTTLGFEAKGHLARVLWNRGEGAAGPRTHMLLSVAISGGTYLADVGFGGLTLTAPLKLRSGVEQETPHGLFRLSGEDGALRLEAQIGEHWRALYEFDTGEAFPTDLEALNDFASTNPQSPFVGSLIAARAPDGRRLSLVDTRFSDRPVDGEPEIRMLSSLAELREVLAGPFGISLPAGEKLDPVLLAILEKAGGAA